MNVHPNLYQHHGRLNGIDGNLLNRSDDHYFDERFSASPSSERSVYFRILSGLCMSRGCVVNGRAEQEAMEITVLINMAGIMGAGLSAYVGVRVALAHIQTKVEALEKAHEKHDRRLDRLEGRYFRPRNDLEE